MIIGENQIGDEGVASIVEVLKTNATLITLDIGNILYLIFIMYNIIIGGNYIGDQGAASIAEALKTNATLTTLNISNNINGIYIMHNYHHRRKSNYR